MAADSWLYGTFTQKAALVANVCIRQCVRVPNALIVAAAVAALNMSPAFGAKPPNNSSPVAVSISSPAGGSAETASFTTSGSASTSARHASIASVRISVDGGAWQGASGTTSWIYSISGLASGGHTILAMATDTAGNSATSSISVTIVSPTSSTSTTAIPPTSTIVWPRYANTLVAGPYTLSGSSSDSTYSITKVQWAIDGAIVDSATGTCCLNYTWDTTTAALGSHTITYTTWNSAGASSSASLPITVGTAAVKRVAVILYNFDNQTPPTTPQTVFDWTFGTTRSVAGYYQEESYGRLLLGGALDMSGDVFGFYTIPYDFPTTSTCDFTDWESSALQQAAAGGFNANSYDVYMLTASVPSGCGSGVGGSVQDRVPWNNVTTPDEWVGFAGHELGHSFGIHHHAHSWSCTDSSGRPVQISSTCTSNEYGDPFDIMGQGHVQHMNVYEKGQLGILRSGNVQTVTTSGTYALAPQTTTGTGVISIRIPGAYDAGGNPTDYYYLEYRQPTPYDVLPNNVVDFDGVQIREAPDFSGQQVYVSNLIDTTPGSDTAPWVSDFYDASLTPGRWFQDPNTNINITTVSADSTGATVQIVFGTPLCYRSAPSTSLTPSTQSGTPGQTLYYTLTVANNDSPACGASDLAVTSSVPAGFSQSPATTTVSGLYPAGAVSQWTITVATPGTSASGSFVFVEDVTSNSSLLTGTISGTALVT